MQLEILSPEKVLFDGKVLSIAATASDGTFELLENHAPLVSTLVAGDVKLTTAEQQQKVIPIKGGVLETANNKTIILVH